MLSKAFSRSLENLRIILIVGRRWPTLWDQIFVLSLLCEILKTCSSVHSKTSPYRWSTHDKTLFLQMNILLCVIILFIVHSAKLLNSYWSRAVTLIPNCISKGYSLRFHGNCRRLQPNLSNLNVLTVKLDKKTRDWSYHIVEWFLV